MTQAQIDLDISYLHPKVKAGKASRTEVDRYVDLLLKGNYITQVQYDKFKAERSQKDLNDFLNLGLAVLAATALIMMFDQLKNK